MANTLEVFKKISTPEELAQEAKIDKEKITPFQGELIFETKNDWEEFQKEIRENLSNIDDIIQDKIHTTKKTVKDKVELQQDIVKGEVGLNVLASYEEQKELYNTFEDNLFFAIQRIFVQKETKKALAKSVHTPLVTGKMREQAILETPEKIAQFLEDNDFSFLSTEEKATIKKFQEIIANKDSEIYTKLTESWNQKTALIIESIRQSNAFIEQKEEQENPIMGFIKEHPFISTGIAVLGITLVWKLFSGGEKEKGKEGGGILSSLVKWGLGIGGAILGINLLMGFLGSEKVKNVIKNIIGWDVEKFREAFNLMREGKISEAINLLFQSANCRLRDEQIRDIGKNLSKNRAPGEEEFDNNVIKGLCMLDAKSFIYGDFQDTIGRLFTPFLKGTDYTKQEDEIRKILKSKVRKEDIKEGDRVEDILERYFLNDNAEGEKNNGNHPDGVEEGSISGGLLHIWAKGTKFTLNTYLLRHTINEAILKIDRAGLNIPGKREEKKVLEKMLRILENGGGKLNKRDKKFIDKKIPEFISRHPNKFPDIEITHSYLKEWEKLAPKTRKGFQTELEGIKVKTDVYLKEVNKLTKEKKKLIQEAQRNIKKENKYNIRKILKENLKSNLDEIDLKIARLNNDTSTRIEAHQSKINSLYENLNPKIKQHGRVYEFISEKLKAGGLLIKGSKTVRRGVGLFKFGFIGATVGTLVLDGTTGKQDIGETAGKFALEVAPVTSEFFDFKAAITGIDIWGNSLDWKGRAISAGFGVFGTVVDAASLLTFGQSQWARSGLIGLKGLIKGTKLGGKLIKAGEKLSDSDKLIILKDIIQKGKNIGQSESGLKTVKMANMGGHALVATSLGIAIYEAPGDIMEGGKEAIRQGSTLVAEQVGR